MHKERFFQGFRENNAVFSSCVILFETHSAHSFGVHNEFLTHYALFFLRKKDVQEGLLGSEIFVFDKN